MISPKRKAKLNIISRKAVRLLQSYCKSPTKAKYDRILEYGETTKTNNKEELEYVQKYMMLLDPNLTIVND
jgi:hypothetical protein